MRRHSATILTLPMLALLSACATTPRLDRAFGDSVRQTRAQQTLYPDAGRTPRPVNGIDAQSAAAAYDNYQRSFSTKEESNDSFNIGVGNKR